MPPRATFRDVFAVREFRALWFSEILSVAGDRLALVALTLLVYNRTGLPLLAALTYAAGDLPWVIGGLFLADVADRYPRRTVMVACDVVRAVLVAAMAVPGVPLLALVALLFATTMFTPPFESARAAITPDILQGELYVLGAGVIQTTFLAAQVAGAVGGGIAVAFVGTRPALAIDAATFVLSGLLIAFGIRARPAAARPETVRSSPLARTRQGFRLVFGDPALRTLLLLGWLVAFYTVPEGVAAPYANKTRWRAHRDRRGAGVHGVRHHDRDAAVHPLHTRAAAALPDGAARRAHLRDAGLDGPPPGSGRLTCDFFPVGRVRHVSDRGQYRLCHQGAERAAVSGIRPGQHGCGGRPGGRIRGGRRRGGGDFPGGGHCY